MKSFMTIYYLMLFTLALQLMSWTKGRNFQNADFVLFAEVFELFPNKSLSHVLVLLASIGLGFSAIFVHKRWMRILTAFFILASISMYHSFGKINHSLHAWMVTAVGMCFLNEKKPLSSKFNFEALRILQSLLLSIYFISGLWKIRHIDYSQPYEYLRLAGIDHVAFSMAEGNGPMEFVRDVLIAHPNIIVLGYLLVLAFQLSAIIPILIGRGFALWGALAIVFHIITLVALGINFSHTVMALGLFLIVAESLRKSEMDAA